MKKPILTLLIATATIHSPLASASLGREGKQTAAHATTVRELARALSDFNLKCGSNALERFLISIKRTARLTPSNQLTNREIDACRSARATLDKKWQAFRLTPASFKNKLPAIFVNPEMFSQEKACAELPVGAGRTGLSTQHRVERVGAKDYVAQLNLTFVATAGVAKEEEAKMAKRIDECFESVGFMEDYNGYRLKLRNVDDETARRLNVPKMKIELYSGIRSNSAQYDVNLECNGLVHEGLHLMGLDDEYHEPGMECRAEADSIMANHMDYHRSPEGFFRTKEMEIQYYAMPGTTPVKHFLANRTENPRYLQVEEIACRDDVGGLDERNLKMIGSTMTFKQRTGYSGLEATSILPDVFFVPESETDDSRPLSERPYLAALMKVSKTPEAWTCKLTPVADAKPGTIIQTIGKRVFPLRPAHIRRIVYPSCDKVNAAMNACTKQNYVATAPGQVCLKDQHAICQNEKWLD